MKAQDFTENRRRAYVDEDTSDYVYDDYELGNSLERESLQAVPLSPLDPPPRHGLPQENSPRPPDSAAEEEKHQPQEKKETEKKIHIINIPSLCGNLNILTFILLF